MAIQKALVVDDSKLARLTLGNLLKKQGMKVDEATSGGEALDYLLYNTPDVVFMDFMMPDMDGLEVTARIVNNPKTTAIPVVLCTAQDTPEDRVRAKEKGAQGFLTKPASEATLTQILAELAARQPAVVSTAAAVAVAQPSLDIAALRMELEVLARTTAERTASHVAETLGKSITQTLRADIKTEIKVEMLNELSAIAEETANEISRKVAESTATAAAQRIASELVRKAADELHTQLLGTLKAAVKEAAETAARTQLQAALDGMQDSLREVLSEQKQQFEMEFASNQEIVTLQTELRKTCDQAHKFAKDAGGEARKMAERYTDDTHAIALQAAKDAARQAASGKTLPLVLSGISLLVAIGAIVVAVML
jgi:CheY-like chemotaxis protein